MLKKTVVIDVLCAAGLVLLPCEGRAQRSTRGVLLNATIPNTDLTIPTSAGLSGSAALRAWKTVTLGKFANSFALGNALDAADRGIGDLAEEILARRAFTLASTKTDIDGAEETSCD
jgi:hypothetical protein